jgi:hypothetical protein
VNFPENSKIIIIIVTSTLCVELNVCIAQRLQVKISSSSQNTYFLIIFLLTQFPP